MRSSALIKAASSLPVSAVALDQPILSPLHGDLMNAAQTARRSKQFTKE
jgi:hypothetical protein